MFQRCRICLRTKNAVMVDLEKCYQMIINIAQINIFVDEKLPNMVCFECVHRLVDAYNLREMCIKSEDYLHEELEVIGEEVATEEKEVEEVVLPKPNFKEIPIRCCYCNQYFTEESDLVLHCHLSHELKIQKQDTELYDYECRVCGHTFEPHEFWIHQYNSSKYRRDILRHLGHEMPQSVLTVMNEAVDSVCCQCGSKFGTLLAVRKHVKRTHPHYEPNISLVTKEMCKVCHATFASKEELNSHFKQPEKKVYPCARCDKKFDRMLLVRTHQYEEHPDEPVLFKCNQCDKTFSKYNAVLQHMNLRHYPDKLKHVCDICGKTFKNICYMKEHRQINHFGVKKYKCDRCGKHFPRQKNLKSHMQSHTGEKPYKCPHCEKCYGFHTDLKTHIASKHTGEWPLHCPSCDRGFMKPSQLKLHMETHLKS